MYAQLIMLRFYFYNHVHRARLPFYLPFNPQDENYILWFCVPLYIMKDPSAFALYYTSTAILYLRMIESNPHLDQKFSLRVSITTQTMYHYLTHRPCTITSPSNTMLHTILRLDRVLKCYITRYLQRQSSISINHH